MLDILNEWVKLEPERIPVIGGLAIIRMSGYDESSPNPEDLTSVDYCHLQRSLQEAIASKEDWQLNLILTQHSADGSTQWQSRLYRKSDVEPFVGVAGEAAIALLDSYVQALKADSEQEAN